MGYREFEELLPMMDGGDSDSSKIEKNGHNELLGIGMDTLH